MRYRYDPADHRGLKVSAPSERMDRKIYDPAHGVAPDDWIADLPRPLVFTNGCFDIVAPGASTARIQEIHGIIIHAFCELIDHQLFGEI